MIGLDVGGANCKAAAVDDDGRIRIASEPLEVWRSPDGLADAIASVVRRLGLDGAPVALTMTAELVDVFASKRSGVLHVLDAVESALPDRWLRVMTNFGELIEVDRARADPLSCAAANWVATALLVARGLPDAILIDCGGTTTDLIPIAGGELAARGRTDLQRLLHSELVYTGALRTNIAAVVTSVPIDGRPCPVSAELFAIAADAHRLLGRLTAAQCTCTFPDRRGPEPEHVRARLARVVCADPEQLAPGDLEAIAAAVHDGQVTAIAAALGRVSERSAAGAPVVAVGVGAFLARAAAARCGLDVLELGVPLADAGDAGPRAGAAGGDPGPVTGAGSGSGGGAGPRAGAAGEGTRADAGGEGTRAVAGVPLAGAAGEVAACVALSLLGRVDPAPTRTMANPVRHPDANRHRSSRPPPVVLKVGGGLLGAGRLGRACHDVVELARSRRVLVVPGGGPFADAVRAVDRSVGLGDAVAHRLALAAMDQLGLLLRERLPSAELLAALRAPAGLGLLLAASAFAGRADVPESWAVTSDSLAVLAAAAIGAERAILLKPVDGVFDIWPPAGPPPLAALTAAQLRALQRDGQGRAVDAYLPDAIQRTGITVIVRAPGPGRSPGTRITPG